MFNVLEAGADATQSVSFLEKGKEVLEAMLSYGTSFAKWMMDTEPVNYFVAVAFILIAIGLVLRIVRH